MLKERYEQANLPRMPKYRVFIRKKP